LSKIRSAAFAAPRPNVYEILILFILTFAQVEFNELDLLKLDNRSRMPDQGVIKEGMLRGQFM
jgi:hypothetical protein